VRIYIDTSAAIKLLVTEAESEALRDLLTTKRPHLQSSLLLETELRRAAARHDADQHSVAALLDSINLIEMPPRLFRLAGLLPGPGLRSLDALHLATALSTETDAVLTYDARFTEAANRVGLTVLDPTSSAGI
jgi:predicted nucleic acid-binding protein